MFSVQVPPLRDGASQVLIHAAATGLAASEGDRRVGRRLQIEPLPPADPASAGNVAPITGTCPATEIAVAAVEVPRAEPLAATSGHGALHKNECLEPGMDGYMSMPPDPQIRG